MRKLALLFVFLSTALLIANAQYVTNGNATSLGGDCFRLTTTTTGQSGSFWFQNKISLASDLTVNATINLGTRDPGADGIAFVLQPVCSGLGGAGGGLGYFGITPSLAVEFDTYQNTDRGDPAEDHIGLMKNGSVNHGPGGASVLQGYHTLPNLENGLNHSVLVQWTASTQNLKVTLDGVLQVDYTDNIVANIFSGNRNVFWGFTAATGSEYNNQSVCIISKSFVEEGSYTVTKATCPAYNNGAIDLNPAGGVPNFTYLWSNGATTEDISGLSAGNYSVTVTDGNGCKSVYTNIVVSNEIDNQAPVITCPSNVTVSNDPGLCGAAVTYTISARDNCTNCSAPMSIPGYTLYGSFGGHTYFRSDALVLWPAANVAANALGGHLATVTSAAENAFLSNNIFTWIGLTDQVTEGVYQWVTGEPFVFSSWGIGEPNNSGNEDFVEINRNGAGKWNDLPDGFPRPFYVEFDCLTITQTAGMPSGSIFPVGTTTNTFTVTDGAGNQSTCSFDVTVNDTEKPVAKCKPVTVTLVNGTASITAANINDGSTDNCGIQSVTVAPGTFTCSNIGPNTVTLTVTDIHGNINTCTATVTVVGEVPTCSITSIPANNTFTGGVPTTIYLGYGPQSTTLQVSTPASGAPYTYSWYPASGLSNTSSNAPLFTPNAPGNYTFTVLVTNIYGCTTTCSISICVLDIRVPNTDGKKVYVCHYPQGNPGNVHSIEISVNAVSTHIFNPGHGDRLGQCDQSCAAPTMAHPSPAVPAQLNENPSSALEIFAFPNPTSSAFTVRVEGRVKEQVRLRVVDLYGRIIFEEAKVIPYTTLRLGEKLAPGSYIVEAIQGNKRTKVKVLKIK